MFDLLTKYWAIGRTASTPCHWWTPILCRLLGSLYIDPQNGVRVYTYRGVSLLICPTKGQS